MRLQKATIAEVQVSGGQSSRCGPVVPGLGLLSLSFWQFGHLAKWSRNFRLAAKACSWARTISVSLLNFESRLCLNSIQAAPSSSINRLLSKHIVQLPFDSTRTRSMARLTASSIRIENYSSAVSTG